MSQTTPEDASKPLLSEVSSTGDGALKGLGADLHGGFARARDPRLHAMGGEAYRLMLRDDQVQSTFQQRRLAVIARDWSVTPGGDAPADEVAADHLSEQLSRIGFDRVTEKMLYGIFYGYAVAEVLWKVKDGLVEIDQIKVRDRNRFTFDDDRRLRLMRSGSADGELMPDRKFWCFTAGSDHDDDLYGVGLGYHLYWPVWFKREGLKSWLQGLDKTARPTALGKFPTGASQDDIDKLLLTLEAYASDTGIAIPEAMSIELLQAARSATTDYSTLYNRMDAAIAKIVLSQTMTTDSSVAGLGSNQADVHRDVKQEVVKADADLLNESFSATVAQWLTAWNFPDAATPIVTRQIGDAEDLDVSAARDERLSKIGWRPTEERIRETYGEGYERAGSAVTPPDASTLDTSGDDAPATSFAAPVVDRVTAEHALATGLLEDRWEEIMTPLLKPIRALFDRVSSYRAAAKDLSGVLVDMDESAARELLARAGFQLRVAASVGAIDDDDVEAADLAEGESPKKKLLNLHEVGCQALATADFEDFELKPLPPAEAIRFFERKGYRIGFDFRDVWQEEHARSFTVAKVMRLELLKLIRAEVAKGLEDGIPFETFRKNLTPILQREGWWGVKEVVDPLTGETVLAQLGSPRRLRIIFDTNLRTARAAGRWERIERNKARRPFLRYSQIQRPTKRDEHERWHGLIRPVDDPVWDKIYPPNGWNCGCSIQQLTKAEAERRGITPAREAAAILRSRRRFINKRTGEVSTVTRGVDPSFDYNVGKAHLRGAEQALVSALSAGDAAAAQRTLEEAVAGEGFSDFLRSPDRHGFYPVMLIDESIGRRIGAKTRVVRISAETMHKQDREHPDLTEAHYRALPLIGADPDLVIQQNDKTLYMIRQGDHWLVAVVKATQTGKAAFVTSFRGTNRFDVGNLTRRGRVIFRKKE